MVYKKKKDKLIECAKTDDRGNQTSVERKIGKNYSIYEKQRRHK